MDLRLGNGFDVHAFCDGDGVWLCGVKLPHPQFEGQTKTKLGNSEVKGIVEALINDRLSAHFEDTIVIGVEGPERLTGPQVMA